MGKQSTAHKKLNYIKNVEKKKNPYFIETGNMLSKLSITNQKYPLQEKYFFPCDQKDDTKRYSVLKKHIPELLHYDWTQHRVETTLSLLKRADAGIVCRLYFLLPLKV